MKTVQLLPVEGNPLFNSNEVERAIIETQLESENLMNEVLKIEISIMESDADYLLSENYSPLFPKTEKRITSKKSSF